MGNVFIVTKSHLVLYESERKAHRDSDVDALINPVFLTESVRLAQCLTVAIFLRQPTICCQNYVSL